MEFAKELITPEYACRLLDKRYPGQRPIMPTAVNYLARAMSDGKWNNNQPQPVIVSNTGYLLDGQHRLSAVIKSGKAIEMVVVRGVPESAYKDIDAGVSRKLADRVMFCPENPELNQPIASLVNYWWHNTRSSKPSADEAIKFYQEHMLAISWAASYTTNVRGLGTSPVRMALAQMWERNPEKATALMNTVVGGDMKIINGIRLREFLIADPKTMSGRKIGSSIMKYIYQACVAVCKAELRGDTLKLIKPATWDD